MGSGTVSVILNNSTLGWIRQGAASRYPGEMVSQDFLAVSYADAAAALGAATCAAEDLAAFRSAFGQALADRSGRPWVIEVRSCAVESPVQQMPDGARAPGGY
jgi:thiamine pyrophosphate-dependent acetolactate synthase large subunit-like protein